MGKLGFELDNRTLLSDFEQTNLNDTMKMLIQRSIQLLEHALQCRDTNCQLASCQKMKRVVTHTKACKSKSNGSCPICKQLITLCCFHAKHCQETKCPVLFCLSIRHKLDTQAPTANVMGDGGKMQITSESGVPPVSVPGTVSSVGTMNSSMGANELTIGRMQQPHQPGITLKPGTQTMPDNVLQVVKQVQEEGALQQVPHGTGFGKVNLGAGVPGQNMPPAQIQMKLSGHISPGQASASTHSAEDPVQLDERGRECLTTVAPYVGPAATEAAATGYRPTSEQDASI